MPQYASLGQMRAELRVRLGLVAQGPATGRDSALLTSFIRDAYHFIWSELELPLLHWVTSIKISGHSWLYDWNDDTADMAIEPGKVLSMSVCDGTHVEPLQHGVSAAMWAQNITAMPTRWDNFNGQIGLWPIPDQDYRLEVHYMRSYQPLVDDKHRPLIDDRLIFSYALAMAKGHFKHADASAVAEQFKGMMLLAKQQQHSAGKRYVIAHQSAHHEPQVRVSAGKYVL